MTTPPESPDIASLLAVVESLSASVNEITNNLPARLGSTDARIDALTAALEAQVAAKAKAPEPAPKAPKAPVSEPKQGVDPEKAQMSDELQAIRASLAAMAQEKEELEKTSRQQHLESTIRHELSKHLPDHAVPNAMARLKVEGMMVYKGNQPALTWTKDTTMGPVVETLEASKAIEKFLETPIGKSLRPAKPITGTGDRGVNTRPSATTGATVHSVDDTDLFAAFKQRANI